MRHDDTERKNAGFPHPDKARKRMLAKDEDGKDAGGGELAFHLREISLVVLVAASGGFYNFQELAQGLTF